LGASASFFVKDEFYFPTVIPVRYAQPGLKAL